MIGHIKNRLTHFFGRYEVWLAVIFLVAVFFRFYNLGRNDITMDEQFSIFLSSQPLSLIWSLTGKDVHPPLYYILLHGWINVVGADLFAARTLSALLSVGSVFLGVKLARSIGGIRVAVMAGLLLAVFPAAIDCAQTVRMYPLLCCLLLGATIALIRWSEAPHTRASLVAYTVLMTAAMYTHYFTVFCALAHWVYLLLLRLRKLGGHHYVTQKAWWLANAMGLLLFVPWMPSFVSQLSNSEGLDWLAAWDLSIMSPLFMLWSFFAGVDYGSYPTLFYVLFFLLILMLSVGAIVSDRTRLRKVLLLVVFTFLPIVVVFGISLIKPMFLQRYLIFAALGLPILVALALAYIAREHRVIAASVLFAVGLVESGFSLNLPENTSMQTLHAYFEAHAGSNDVVIADNILRYYQFDYYNGPVRRTLLYPRASNDCPSAYGAATLLYEHRRDVYIYNLARIEPGRTVWLLDSNQADDKIVVPEHWRALRSMAVGENQLESYAVENGGPTQTLPQAPRTCAIH